MRALTTKEVLEIVGISRTAHYEKLNPKSSSFDPDYPKKKKIRILEVT
jgi:predicted DNA-binding transcriptional regulator AlpA